MVGKDVSKRVYKENHIFDLVVRNFKYL